jgi:threonine/homoserine/homoserine lactone efflux protein
MLFATYIRNESSIDEDKSLKIGTAGALFSFLAVGCPVCNKIALIALGYSGAIKYFAPVQPYLAILGVVVLSYALIKRLDGEIACKILTK